jgi:hypothetical protein
MKETPYEIIKDINNHRNKKRNQRNLELHS